MHSKFVNTMNLGHSIIGMREDGIVEIDFSDTLEIDVKEAKEMVVATGSVSQGKKVLVLNVAGSLTTATAAARDFAASAEAVQYTLAEAYVVSNLAQKIVGNFYVNFHKPQVPTKIFTNTEEAVKWLKSLNL